MKIVFTGGSTGGHFYPLIAVAERLHELVDERKLLEPEFIYIGPRPFDASALVEQNIRHVYTPAGKLRRTGGIGNFLGMFATAWGVVRAIFQLFAIYPDVIFSKGSYAAFPTLVAARILRIPVIIHESDSVPGRVNAWSAKFARWIGIAHPGAAEGFSKRVRDRIALVGNPIRKEIEHPAAEGGYEFLKLDPNVPTIFIMGGSQGAESINNVVLDSLSTLVEKYNIVHQTGKDNLEDVESISQTILSPEQAEKRYRPFGLLNTLAIRMVAGVSSLIISRAGSGTIFEIASWGIPSILIPIPKDVSHDQTRNAFSYARTGAAAVLKQRNVTPHILIAEVERIMSDEKIQENMKQAALAFARPDAAQKIAKVVLDTALEHTQ